jgi:hypothetical protein
MSYPPSQPPPGSPYGPPGAPHNPPPSPPGGPYGAPPPAPGYPAPGYPPPGYPPAGYPPPGAPQGPPPGYLPPAPVRPQPRSFDGFAVAGFVTSLLCLIPVALILSIVALGRIKRNGTRGKGLAVAGLVISILSVLVVVAAVFAALQTPSRDDSGQITDSGRLKVDAIRPGDCFSTLPSGVTMSVPAIPCSQTHVAQAVSAFDLPDGPYPPESELQSAAEDGCFDRLAPDLQDRVGSAEVGLYYFSPQPDGWKLGDHQVLCVIGSDSGPLTETFPVS